ncbi:hypothetical protein K353_05782 [Kitasatospora sp. SolWspMP-SS2h]|nr:hypothetical protein K353_05782 [Kitasatospora sp. SolWspMP-SS2h]
MSAFHWLNEQQEIASPLEPAVLVESREDTPR